jgi:UDP:flavonoid glycosyltransferase YjiC (YdhE family)
MLDDTAARVVGRDIHSFRRLTEGNRIAMKFLFTAGGRPAIVFAVAPLAAAARSAGHEILVVVHEPGMETAEAIGLPAVSVAPEPIRGQRFTQGSARLDALLDLAADWPPDLVFGGLSHFPRVLAARLKVPYVRQAWVPMMAEKDRTDEEEIQPELERLGLAELPDPALFIDVTPPSLRPSRDTDARSIRWIPSNRQRRLERWMYTRPKGRHRVLITSGALMLHTPGGAMRQLVDRLVQAGAEVLIDGAAEKLGAELGDVRVDAIPLDVVAPTCDLAVHLGGSTVAMTFMNAGVPQLVIPGTRDARAIAHGLSGYGAAAAVTPQQGTDQDAVEVIAAGCQEILSAPRYTERARDLAAEIAALPTPADVLRTLEALAAG